MDEDRFAKVYPIKKEGEVYVIEGKPQTQRPPKFLAINPLDDELFLLTGNHGSYELLKGNKKNGLRFCVAAGVEMFGDCFIFSFLQDGQYGVITDPDNFPRENPRYHDSSDCRLQDLKVVPFKIL